LLGDQSCDCMPTVAETPTYTWWFLDFLACVPLHSLPHLEFHVVSTKPTLYYNITIHGLVIHCIGANNEVAANFYK